jgi:hypothetical protein
LKLLNTHRVEYLLIGGYAVGYHGHPRATGDLDVWIAASPENASRLLTALEEFGFSQPDLTAEDIAKEHQIIRMGMPPFRIEVLTSISGVTFYNCFRRRIIDTIDGVEVNIISFERLKKNKLAAGRHKDLADLDSLP